MFHHAASILFATFSGIVILFQAFLAAGIPWGAASMAGRYPGKYPPHMRLVAILNIFILAFFIAIVWSKAELGFPQLRPIAEIGIWFIVVFYGIGTLLNSISPSKIERIWAPVALAQLITSLLVALE